MWTRRRRMWTGRPVRCGWLTEARGLAGGGSAAPGGCVVVRDQRHQRPRHPRGGTRRPAPAPAADGRRRPSCPWCSPAAPPAACGAQAARLRGLPSPTNAPADVGVRRWCRGRAARASGVWWWRRPGRAARRAGRAGRRTAGLRAGRPAGRTAVVFSGQGSSGRGWAVSCMAGSRCSRSAFDEVCGRSGVADW